MAGVIAAVNVMQYVKLLDETQKKIEYLEAELAKNRKLAVALKAMIPLSAKKDAPPIRKSTTKQVHRNPERLEDDSVQLLWIIADKEKDTDTILNELGKVGISMKKPSLRARLSFYRKNFDLVESSRPGLHKLSENGRNYLKKNYPRPTSSARRKMK